MKLRRLILKRKHTATGKCSDYPSGRTSWRTPDAIEHTPFLAGHPTLPATLGAVGEPAPMRGTRRARNLYHAELQGRGKPFTSNHTPVHARLHRRGHA